MSKNYSRLFIGVLASALFAASLVFNPLPTLAALTEPQIDSIIAILSSFGVDAATLANVNGILHGLPPVSTGGSCPNLERNLAYGMTGDDVTALQQYLAADPSVYPEGTVSGFYGSLTQAAVQRFQAKYGIVSSGTPETTGYGAVGPRTRAEIATVCVTLSNPGSGTQTGGDTGQGQTGGNGGDEGGGYTGGGGGGGSPPADTTPPSVPTNLASASTTAETVSLVWDASTDDVGVAGYDIYENSTQIASGSDTSYVATGLTCGTSYTFGVDAFDAAGNHSGQASIQVTTDSCGGGGGGGGDTQAPTTPTNFAGILSGNGKRMNLSWSPSTDDTGVVGYGLYENGVSSWSTASTTYNFTNLACNTSYTFGVDAFDAAGNRSAQATLPATTTPPCGDTTPPSEPVPSVATSTQTSITVTWPASTDDTGVAGYEAYENKSFVATTTATAFVFSGLTCGTTYALGIDAYDAAGNYSKVGSVNGTTSSCGNLGSGTKIVVPTYPTDAVIVAVANVTDFGASVGSADNTNAFQKALDYAGALGGGIVWVPDGTYQFQGTLKIDPSVTLEGDWKQPTASDKTVAGTILSVSDSAATRATSFIRMQAGSGVEGLTIFYAGQTTSLSNYQNVIAYPAAIADSGSTNNASITRVTLVNPYAGIVFSSGGTDHNFGGLRVRDVYMAPLGVGEFLANFGSIPYSTDVHISPDYWAGSGLAGAPSASAIASYALATSTVGFYFHGYGGAGHNVDLSVDNYATGVLYDDPEHGGTDPTIFGLSVTGANRGLVINTPGQKRVYITSSTLSANSGTSPAAVYISPSSDGGDDSILLASDSTFSSTGTDIDDESTLGYGVSAIHSTFSSWSGYAIKQVSGTLIADGSTFTRGSNTNDLSLGASVSQAVLQSNTFTGGVAKTQGGILSANFWENDLPFSLPALGISGFASINLDGPGANALIPPEPLPARVGTDSLYVVTDYGAATTSSDNTQAFQSALTAAAHAGGGTVYVPAGTFNVLGQISIPSGVLLKGAGADSRFNTNTYSTGLVVTGGSAPSILLGAHAGIEGLLIWQVNQGTLTATSQSLCPGNAQYNNQTWSPKNFTYTIQSQGPGAWAENLDLGNVTNGLDFGTFNSSGHYISDIRGSAFQNMVYASKSSSGYMGYVSQTEAEWTSGSNSPELNAIGAISPANPVSKDCVGVGQTADPDAQGTGILLGSAKNEYILDPYSYEPHTGLTTVSDGGQGPSFTVLDLGAENYTAFDIGALDPAGSRIIDADYHTVGAGAPYLIVRSTVPTSATPDLNIFQMRNFTPTSVGLNIQGGNTRIQGYATNLGTKGSDHVSSLASVSGTGILTLSGASVPQNQFSSGIVTASGTSLAAIAGSYLLSPYTVSGSVNLTFQPGSGGGGGDTQAPTVPAGLTVTGTTATTASLSWTASTDNVGVTGYTVYRNGTAVGATTTTSYTDTGLTANTTYHYTVDAYDAAGNHSAQSSAVSATTSSGGGDTQPPTAPTGLTGVGTKGIAVLVWLPSTDNVGVTGYKVFRNSVQVATTILPAYTDTGVGSGQTYAYYVEAFDAAGNVSAPSNTANVAITGFPAVSWYPVNGNTTGSIEDFFIQDVCLDASGNVLMGVSPIDGNPNCVSVRDLKPGESLPYHEDNPRNAGTTERVDQFPIDTGTALGIIPFKIKDGYTPGATCPSPGGVDNCPGALDITDGPDNIFVVSPTTISSYMTIDGNGPTYHSNQLCVPPATVFGPPLNLNYFFDTRVRADISIATGATSGEINSISNKFFDTGACPTLQPQNGQLWKMAYYQYQKPDGSYTQPLLSLVATGDVSPPGSEHDEDYYYTRELGYTRFEAWQNLYAKGTDFSDPKVASWLAGYLKAECTQVDQAVAEQEGISSLCEGANPTGTVYKYSKDTTDDCTSKLFGPPPAPPDGNNLWGIYACGEWTSIAPPSDPVNGDYPTDFVTAAKNGNLTAPLFGITATDNPKVTSITCTHDDGSSCDVNNIALGASTTLQIHGTGFVPHDPQGQVTIMFDNGNAAGGNVAPNANGTEVDFPMEWTVGGNGHALSCNANKGYTQHPVRIFDNWSMSTAGYVTVTCGAGNNLAGNVGPAGTTYAPGVYPFFGPDEVIEDGIDGQDFSHAADAVALAAIGAKKTTVTTPPTLGVGGTTSGGGTVTTGGGTTTTGGSCSSVSSGLTVGSSGVAVTNLQNALIKLGYSVPSGATGYYGAQTQAAVQTFQARQGIVSSGTAASTGYGAVGPRTAAALTAACGGSPTVGTGSGGTTGGSGTSAPSGPVLTSPATTTVPVTTVTNKAPTVTVSASPTTIQSGQHATLSWSAANAQSCQIRNTSVGTVLVATTGVTGSYDLAPTQTTSYQVSCSNTNGTTMTTTSGTATVIVGAPVQVTTTPKDTTSPTPPALSGASSGGAVVLNWTASTDNVGVDHYNVNRDGTKIAQVNGTSYTDTGVTAGSSHTYFLKAVDAAGNSSVQSNQVTVTVKAVLGTH